MCIVLMQNFNAGVVTFGSVGVVLLRIQKASVVRIFSSMRCFKPPVDPMRLLLVTINLYQN